MSLTFDGEPQGAHLCRKRAYMSSGCAEEAAEEALGRRAAGGPLPCKPCPASECSAVPDCWLPLQFGSTEQEVRIG